VLYLDGVKYGDVQMTAMGMLMTVAFTTVSRSKPLDKLSSVQPLTSIFHPSSFISLLGQFSVHFFIMMVAVRAAKEHLPPEYEPDLDGLFHPGILNSVVFLVSNVQQVTVFVVNLQGHPFMTGLTENRPLLYSLIATFILTFMFASESVPSLNKYFQLVPFPDEVFRDYILKLLAADVFFTFAIDRLMKLIFAPQILFASIKGTSMKDVFKVVKTIVIIMFIMNMFLGNDEQWEEMLKEEGREGEMMGDNDGVLNASEVILDDLSNNDEMSGSNIGFGEL
jgi:cation-transporting ATPase 13A1